MNILLIIEDGLEDEFIVPKRNSSALIYFPAYLTNWSFSSKQSSTMELSFLSVQFDIQVAYQEYNGTSREIVILNNLLGKYFPLKSHIFLPCCAFTDMI